jgi:plastocyanin
MYLVNLKSGGPESKEKKISLSGKRSREAMVRRMLEIIAMGRLKQTSTPKPICLVLMIAMVTLTSCGPRSALGPAYLIYPEIRPIKIELRSFSFEPNHFVILQNHSPFTLRLTNTADTLHNFTPLDQRKSVILKKDLIPNESIIFTVERLSPGNYLFYCNRFLHRHRGMEGMLMVE